MALNLVSVIIPCFNQGLFLDESLQSVISQSYGNWECIIVNDGSSDDTKVIAEKWTKKDKRIKYIYQENQGLSSARNLGISNAIGQFILPLDADDKLGSEYLDLAVREFQKNDDLKIVYCKAEKFGIVTEQWALPTFSMQRLAIGNIIFCSALFKKKDWEICGGYDENMLFGWEDWELWISLLKNGGDIMQIDSIQFYYRIKESSMLQSMSSDTQRKIEEYLSIKHADFFVKQLGTFQSLIRENDKIANEYEEKIKSEKFIINSFFKRFLGLSIFKNK